MNFTQFFKKAKSLPSNFKMKSFHNTTRKNIRDIESLLRKVHKVNSKGKLVPVYTEPITETSNGDILNRVHRQISKKWEPVNRPKTAKNKPSKKSPRSNNFNKTHRKNSKGNLVPR